MKTPDLPPDEEERLRVLRSCNILDTLPEPAFDTLTSLAQQLLRVPISLITLIDSGRQWFKSKQGLTADETPRDISICAHAVASRQPLVLEDARTDPRFADNPDVVGGLGIRFYAGVPLVTHDGYALGTLCVIDTTPRQLSRDGQKLLSTLAAQATAHLEKRRETAQLAQQLRAMQQTQATLIALSADSVLEQSCPLLSHLSGYSSDELVGQSLAQLLSPEAWTEHVRQRDRSLAQPAGSLPKWTQEVRLRRRDGGTVPVAIESHVVVSVAGPGLLAKLRDQTAEKATEQALIDSETRLRKVIDTAAEAIIIASGAGTIEQVNSSTSRLFGYTPEELIGQNLRQLMPDKEAAAHDGYLANYVRTAQPRIIGVGREVTARRKDGSLFVAGLAVSEFMVGGHRCYAGILRDLSEQKRVEAELVAARDAAEEASRAKSQFLANMSHEIRTPLNAVLGYATLLLDTPLAASQHEHVQAICNAANSLLGQLNAVLDFSKIEANKLDLELEPTDLILAMEDAVEIVAEQARSKGLRLTCILESDCPTHVVCDPGRLRQVLLNLAHNALKFTERGEVVIRAARRQTATGWEVLFTVRDTGAGIPSDSQSKLFQPFTQADPSIARRHGGSGLGLSICRRLVEALGG
ncbi:MAG TPA: PAS domain S-box protein, partial [Pseudomonadota bacterium]|nr:PAS domain S-box protein [Pseudomonadota bacterium]